MSFNQRAPAIVLALFALLIFLPDIKAQAQAAPAVSGINARLAGYGGWINEDRTRAGLLSLSAPLGWHFGIQADGAYGEIGEDLLKGVGFHLFTRDPERYLLGVQGSHAELFDIDINRQALEAEIYHGALSLLAVAGYQRGDVDSAAFGSLDLRWYPLEDLMLEAGGAFADSSNDKVHLGAEYLLRSGLSAFVDLAAGENRYDHLLFGLKLYLGKSKTLLQRHRRDDPSNIVWNGLVQGMYSLKNAANHKNRQGN